MPTKRPLTMRHHTSRTEAAQETMARCVVRKPGADCRRDDIKPASPPVTSKANQNESYRVASAVHPHGPDAQVSGYMRLQAPASTASRGPERLAIAS